MKIVAIIQARMGSTRLPGKVLEWIHGKSMIGHIIVRLSTVENIHQIVVATTTLERDEPIVEEVSTNWPHVLVYRGSEEDVLSRYYEAVQGTGADTIIRITADCPLIDPMICRDLISYFQIHNLDYAELSGFPRGLDMEIFTASALISAHDHCTDMAYREHVTLYMYRNPEHYHIGYYSNKVDESHYRWTVDTYEDLMLIRGIFDELYEDNHLFGWRDVMNLMDDRPELAAINTDIRQKSVEDL